MLRVLRNTTYAKLFSAQAIALVGVGNPLVGRDQMNGRFRLPE
ncbi:hypothetical protein [Microbacterium sp. R86528]